MWAYFSTSVEAFLESGSLFFLWGHLKTRVFEADPPRIIQALKHRIVDEIADKPGNMLRQVMRNFLLVV